MDKMDKLTCIFKEKMLTPVNDTLNSLGMETEK